MSNVVNINDELTKGFQTAFIDSQVNSSLAYRPQFISNNYEEGKKVLTSLEEELKSCDAFYISVAFITLGGITPLLQTFRELEQKNVPGKILTTDYLNFSEPKALEKINSLSNIELKMFKTNDVQPSIIDPDGDSTSGYSSRENSGSKVGFHTKGYIFKNGDVYQIITGSSNLTMSALTKNKEWNTKVVSKNEGEYAKAIMDEFNVLWNSDNARSFDDFIDEYTTKYKLIKEQRKIAKSESEKTGVVDIEKYKLQPNKMQAAFVSNLKKLYLEDNQNRGLLISATGTGKTYASAFAMRELGFNKVLFLVHRNQIAKQAMKSFRKVFDGSKSMGVFTGKTTLDEKENIINKDFVFATIQTMRDDAYLLKFDKNHFDAIIYDEAHHSSAGSYRKVMEYFEPKFTLGMTATPDRREADNNNQNIYEIYNHNIAYEIRLQQAMEEDLLCPFHYFGITDLSFVEDVADKENKLSMFNMLTSDERVKYVMQQAKYYGYSGSRVKGLIFVSNKKEGAELSNKFNALGWRTMLLTGEDDDATVRQPAIERLVMDEERNEKGEGQLDYLITINIFSEGVDIPEINQVIMLRPTESPIVFIQQLGRGLRKSDDKEFVVVLDFIGNYKNNFMIPIALSGDRTYNKDTIRKYLIEGNRVIPGASTIHFDEISKQKVFDSIDKFSVTKKLLTEKYNALKERLNRIPSLMDFYNQGEVDPMVILDYAGTYYHFLKMVDKSYTAELTEEEQKILDFVSKYVASGIRIYEPIILRCLIDNQRISKNEIANLLHSSYRLELNDKTFESAINVLNGKFINSAGEKKRVADIDIVKSIEGVFESRFFAYCKNLLKKEFLKQLDDLIDLGVARYRDIYQRGADSSGLSLYNKYSRKDVCRILNWEKDDSSTVYGYKIKYNTCPIFVTYNKSEDIAKSTLYEDEFIDNNVFSWMTRSRVSLDSTEAQKLIHYKEDGLKVYLFVKKSDGEGTDFYYMGEAIPEDWKETVQKDDDGKSLPIVNFLLKLKNPVREDIYSYITSDNIIENEEKAQ